jgi:hypothetical protein
MGSNKIITYLCYIAAALKTQAPLTKDYKDFEIFGLLFLRELKREFNSKLDPIIPIYRKPKVEDLVSTIMVQPIKNTCTCDVF